MHVCIYNAYVKEIRVCTLPANLENAAEEQVGETATGGTGGGVWEGWGEGGGEEEDLLEENIADTFQSDSNHECFNITATLQTPTICKLCFDVFHHNSPPHPTALSSSCSSRATYHTSGKPHRLIRRDSPLLSRLTA